MILSLISKVNSQTYPKNFQFKKQKTQNLTLISSPTPHTHITKHTKKPQLHTLTTNFDHFLNWLEESMVLWEYDFGTFVSFGILWGKYFFSKSCTLKFKFLKMVQT